MLLDCNQDEFDSLICLQNKDMVDVLMLSELNEVSTGVQALSNRGLFKHREN